MMTYAAISQNIFLTCEHVKGSTVYQDNYRQTYCQRKKDNCLSRQKRPTGCQNTKGQLAVQVKGAYWLPMEYELIYITYTVEHLL